MMSGGGGDGCNRADRGTGVTEARNARFGTRDCVGDIRDSCSTPTQ